MQQCTTSSRKRRRTQESLIREGGKADAALCVRLWKRHRHSAPGLSIRAFAKLIWEAESTVRHILGKGTTAGRLTYWLPGQKERGYFDLSPTFAAEETRRRASNKGPLPHAHFPSNPPRPAQFHLHSTLPRQNLLVVGKRVGEV